MKRNSFIVIISLFYIVAFGQSNVEMSKIPTVYSDFQPAHVYMASGDTVTAYANVFLKNSSLYIKQGAIIMEADVKDVLAVQFKDKKYIKIDTLLATIVDTCKNNELLCARMIDMAALIGMKKNASMVTNIDFSLNEYINVNRFDTSKGLDVQFPIHRKYFYYYDGKYVPVDDRNLYKFIPKDKRAVYNTITKQESFDWYNEDWLMKLLKYIS